MLRRLLTGDDKRKTRLHNYNGQFLDAAGFLYLPQSILTTLSFKLAHRRPELPWLSFRATKYLDRIIKHEWKVLEFGSGMSTIWFARRCGRLVSIETDRVWYDAVTAKLAARGLDNVDYRLCPQAEAHLLRDYEDASFDLVLVDGLSRDRAMLTALTKVKPGGYVYLDNSDMPYQAHRTAKAMLLNAAGGAANVKIFNDLSPTRVYVTEGILAAIANKPT
jgi:predicted O-methyltransferase YrrM